MGYEVHICLVAHTIGRPTVMNVVKILYGVMWWWCQPRETPHEEKKPTLWWNRFMCKVSTQCGTNIWLRPEAYRWGLCFLGLHCGYVSVCHWRHRKLFSPCVCSSLCLLCFSGHGPLLDYTIIPLSRPRPRAPLIDGTFRSYRHS